MTYLNLVNNVLRRLREEEVNTVNENSFSTMVGDFVNDAKRIVEDATDWSGLRRTIQVETDPDIHGYILGGTQNRGRVLDVVNMTSKFFMEYKTAHEMNHLFLVDEPDVSTPRFFSYNGSDDTSGDTKIDLYPIPDGIYDLHFNMVVPQEDLTTDDQLLKIPAHPIIHLAVALLARERGETGGTSAAEYFQIANKYLSDAVAMDASKHPEEMVWYS